LLQLRHSGAALAFIAVGIAWCELGFIGFGKMLGPFRILAPISYAVYILHAPPLTQVSLRIQRGECRVFAAGAVLSLVLAVAFLLEARLQVKINRWTDGWLRRLRSSATNAE
jgi:peptidoglycan/LPS O-acetylase OafA/YrhL